MEQADPIETLFARAKEHRIPMSTICRRADVDPTTPSRWKRQCNGANMGTVKRLQDALSDILTDTAAAA